MEEKATPDWPAIYRILADETRRELIHYLLDSDEQTALDELVDSLDLDDEHHRERVRVRLCHVTLPMMEDAALLEWDRDANRIELSNTTYQVPLGALSPPDVPVLAEGHRQRADD